MAAVQNPYLLLAPAFDGHEGGLRDDFQVLKHNVSLPEHQLYAVEQWVVDRARATSTFVVPTNDASHKIAVDIFTPRTEDAEQRSVLWDRALQTARASGARPKQTNLGFVFVVSLLGFRSDLAIVLIPDGDFGASRDALYTNINLRRLGCGGRSGLSLSEPSPSQQERLLQAYRLPSTGNNPASFTLTLLSLVKLVQAALALFDMGPLNRKQRFLSEPDGLICDSTVAGLVAWQIEVAEPLLDDDLGTIILSAATLSALLSMVMSVRCRLLAMGISGVPSDPFEDRAAFLRSYDSFLKTTRNPPDSRYLSAAGIMHLKQQYTRTTKESFKRVLRHRLDDFRGGEGVASSKSGIFEDEIVDINSFVLAVQNYGHHDMSSITDLWKGRLRKDTYFAPRKSAPKSEEVSAQPKIVVSDDEDETGLGSKLLKGVSKRTKRIGDGVTGRSGMEHESHEDNAKLNKSHNSSILGRSYDNMSSLLADSFTNEPRPPFSPYQSVLSLRRSPSPAGTHPDRQDSQDTDMLHVRPVNMRRAATETNIQPTCDESKQQPKNMVLNETRWRRHSFNCQRDGPIPTQIMSARRMKMDVDLHTSYYELRKREAHLARVAKALEDLKLSYVNALAKITPSIKQRGQTVEQLSTRSAKLQHDIETFIYDAADTQTNRHRQLSRDTDQQESQDHEDLNVSTADETLKQALLASTEQVSEVQSSWRELQQHIGGSNVLFDKDAAKQLEASGQTLGSVVRILADLANKSHGSKWIRELVSFYGRALRWMSGGRRQ